jgi:hypothetical protein
MSTLTCCGCGRKIESTGFLTICPHCHSIQKTLGIKIAGCMVLLAIIFAYQAGIGGYLSDYLSSRGSESRTPAPREAVAKSAWDGSVRQVETYLKRNLKDPGSFDAIEWSAVEKIDLPTHKYQVRCKYRAKNSFGAYVISNQIFYLDKDGNVVNARDF